MASSSKKLITKVNAVSTALDDLELKLEPLLSHPLPKTLNALDTLQQAKLNVLLPYLINDLIFIYLKCRGVDPKTHPVVAELDRVRRYFAKIKDAEESGSKQHPGIDKAAAGRFIKHAIAQAKQSSVSTPKDEEPPQAGPSKSVEVPVKITEKMLQREQHLKEVRDALNIDDDDDDGEDLEIIDNVEDEETNASSEKVVSAGDVSRAGKKRRMPIDPFTGAAGDTSSSPSKKKSKKIAKLIDEETPASSQDSIASPSDKKKRKKKRKSKATT